MAKKAVIIGAGPAGLTAGLELLRRTEIVPVILEASEEIGGISRTIRYKGNRMDIGGHRFFSKSDRVMEWWVELMPPELCRAPGRLRECGRDVEPAGRDQLSGQAAGGDGSRAPARGAAAARAGAAAPRRRAAPRGRTEEDPEEDAAETVVVPEPENPDLVMLIRPRRSRIYYLRKFFDYPITLTATTLKNLGVVRMARVGTSYAFSRVHQIRPEKSLEDFLINRFGRELYLTFFKSYTEKVWGTPCHEISAEWGAQRIKGLSLTTAVKHLVKKMFRAASEGGDLAQKGTDTSLIERFMYPKFGPGQLWEHVAELVQQKGGEIQMGWKVERLNFAEGGPLRVTSIEAVSQTDERRTFAGDYFFSTMPMRDLLRAMNDAGAGECSRSQRRIAVPRLHHRGAAGGQAEGDRAGRRPAEGHMDLYSGAGCAAGAAADLQQLEPIPGKRSGEGLDRAGVLLLRDGRSVEDGRRGDEEVRHRRGGEDRNSERGGRERRACGARAQDLPGVLRHLRPLRRAEGRLPIASRTCSWWDATGCTSTTTRTTAC